MHVLDRDVRDAYLHRLGLDAEPPSVAALARLHRRHVERVPYETLWIHGGEGMGTALRHATGLSVLLRVTTLVRL